MPRHIRRGDTVIVTAGKHKNRTGKVQSNVSPVVDGQATRVRFETNDDGSKARVAVRGGKVLHTLRGKTKKK